MTQYLHEALPNRKFKGLDRAMANDAVCRKEIQETRTLLRLFPIFLSTIMGNCCVAQLTTFNVQQGSIMNRKLGHKFKVPPPSSGVIPLIIILLFIFTYECLAAMLPKNLSAKRNNIFAPIKHMGMGLLLIIVAMTVAAIVEVKLRNAAEVGAVVPVFWLGWQYLILGLTDMLTLGSMLDFFYSEAT